MSNQQCDSRARSTAHVTIATCTKPGRLTKLWKIEDGVPNKQSAGQMVEGCVDITEAATPSDLIAILKGLQSDQALIMGLPPGESHRVVTTEMLPKSNNGAIARTREFFGWNHGPGWMMIDHDSRPGADPLTRQQLLDSLFEVAPELKSAPMVWGVSGSSEIYNADTGEQITGTRGQRLYILVSDARDIPRAGEALFDRLWLARYGYYLVSKSGQLLKRATVDGSVWLSERLDFAAPPVCVLPLETRRPDPISFNNDAVPINLSRAMPSLSKDEKKRLEDIQVAARKAEGLTAQQNEARNNWIDNRLASITPKEGETSEDVRQKLIDAVTNHRLFGEFELLCSTGEKVTIGQMLENPDRWHGKRFHDPLEPDYLDDNRIAWVNLKSGGKPYIFSHAHGGIKYTLLRQQAILKLEQGEMPRMLHEILNKIRLDGAVFERANIVRAHGGCVTVESIIGRGSTFRVFLPLTVGEIPRQPDKAATPLAIEKGGTVLVVDDETMVRDMATTMLKRLGFSVLAAKDGVEAVEIFRERKDEIRLVLSDLTMPRMNGWETLTALRNLAPDVPVILASGYDKAHVMAGDHPELPQVFLGKPYKLKGLSDAVSQALVSRDCTA